MLAPARVNTRWGQCEVAPFPYPGCSKRPSSKAAASEEARRTLRYVEPLSDARTMLAEFFSILLGLFDWFFKERLVGLCLEGLHGLTFC